MDQVEEVMDQVEEVMDFSCCCKLGTLGNKNLDEELCSPLWLLERSP